MDVACSKHGRDNKCPQHFEVSKLKRPLRRSSHNWENNSNTNHRNKVWGCGNDSSNPVLGPIMGVLWTRQWIVGFMQWGKVVHWWSWLTDIQFQTSRLPVYMPGPLFASCDKQSLVTRHCRLFLLKLEDKEIYKAAIFQLHVCALL
jgi:hypothetical protein